MFGAREFEGAQQFGAMDALLEAAGQTGLELPAENSSSLSSILRLMNVVFLEDLPPRLAARMGVWVRL